MIKLSELKEEIASGMATARDEFTEGNIVDSFLFDAETALDIIQPHWDEMQREYDAKWDNWLITCAKKQAKIDKAVEALELARNSCLVDAYQIAQQALKELRGEE